MVEGGGRLGFTLEAPQGLMVRGHFFRQELERDEAVELGVLGLIHHTHSAATELIHDAVVRNRRSNHDSGGPDLSTTGEYHCGKLETLESPTGPRLDESSMCRRPLGSYPPWLISRRRVDLLVGRWHHWHIRVDSSLFRRAQARS